MASSLRPYPTSGTPQLFYDSRSRGEHFVPDPISILSPAVHVEETSGSPAGRQQMHLAGLCSCPRRNDTGWLEGGVHLHPEPQPCHAEHTTDPGSQDLRGSKRDPNQSLRGPGQYSGALGGLESTAECGVHKQNRTREGGMHPEEKGWGWRGGESRGEEKPIVLSHPLNYGKQA